MKHKLHSLLLMIISAGVLFLYGCMETKHPPYNRYGEIIDTLIVNEYKFPFPDSLLGLKSYSSTACLKIDSKDCFVGYNHFQHSLDYFDITQKAMVKSTPLDREGADGVVGKICAMYPYTNNSIWIYDHVHIYLLDSLGKVQRKIFLGDRDLVKIETNHAMHTSRFLYHSAKSSLWYLIQKNNSYYINEYSLDNESVVEEYPLLLSVYNREGKSRFANMDAPNVLFQSDKIIYNYPYESTIYVLDLNSKKHSEYGGGSQYTANVAHECSNLHDYSEWERHGFVNTHFYDVMYLPDLNMYARLHLGGVKYDSRKSLAQLGDGRELYLMLFDHEFKIVGEYRLRDKTYNYHTGWCALPDGILIFKDNALSDTTEYEEIQFDIFKFAKW